MTDDHQPHEMQLMSPARFISDIAFQAGVLQEREACAALCDEFGEEWMCNSHELGKLIRARS